MGGEGVRTDKKGEVGEKIRQDSRIFLEKSSFPSIKGGSRSFQEEYVKCKPSWGTVPDVPSFPEISESSRLWEFLGGWRVVRGLFTQPLWEYQL